MQFQSGHVQQYLRYLTDLVLRQRDVLDRAKQELIAYKEMQRYAWPKRVDRSIDPTH